MKEKLIEMLGLKADASDDAIVGAVNGLVTETRSAKSHAALEKKIAAKIAESGGAMNREQALTAINAQEANAKKK